MELSVTLPTPTLIPSPRPRPPFKLTPRPRPTPKRSLLYRWKLQRQDDRHIRYKRLSDFAAEFNLSKYNTHLCTIDKDRCVALTGGTLVTIHEDESGRDVPVMPRPLHYKQRDGEGESSKVPRATDR